MAFLLGYKPKNSNQSLYLAQGNKFVKGIGTKGVVHFTKFDNVDQTFNYMINHNKISGNFIIANFYAYDTQAKKHRELKDASLDAKFRQIDSKKSQSKPQNQPAEPKSPDSTNTDSESISDDSNELVPSIDDLDATVDPLSEPEPNSSEPEPDPLLEPEDPQPSPASKADQPLSSNFRLSNLAINHDGMEKTQVGSFVIPLRTIDQLVNYITNPHHNCLILDLEFYHRLDYPNDKSNPGSNQQIQQIAGQIFGVPHAKFNYRVFDPNDMSPKDQIDFLAKSNLPYSEAQLHILETIMKKIKAFIRYYDIDTIISYENAMDFYVINQDGFNDLFGGLNSIDLTDILRFNFTGANSNNPMVFRPTSLYNLAQIFNLPDRESNWHQADHDVNVIAEILQTYVFKSLP